MYNGTIGCKNGVETIECRFDIVERVLIRAVALVFPKLVSLVSQFHERQGREKTVDRREPRWLQFEYVPYFEDAPVEPITIRELLSRTSGISSDDMATNLLVEGGLSINVGPVCQVRR